MRRGTLLFLAITVGVLGFLYAKRERDRRTGAGLTPVLRPLLVGFAPGRVSTIRIDNLERAIQVKLERDAQGSWFMTDPVPYPAQDELVRTLLQTLANSLGEPDSSVSPADVKLDPPLVVLELVQEEEQGERVLRLEVGAVDLDASKVYVRVPGHPVEPGLFKAPRTIYNTLDRNPDDYRDRRATHLLAQQVTSFRRKGRAYVEDVGTEIDLTLDALLEPDGWKKVNPPVVTLAPAAIQLLCRGAAELRVDAFAADRPTSMADWGLEPPSFSIELIDERGGSTVLDFGHPEQPQGPGLDEPQAWFCRREGFPHVWEIDPQDVELLIRPADQLYDYLIVRAHRDDIARVELEGDGRSLVIERADEGWQVGAAGEDERFPADPGAVDDLLASIEGTQLGDYPDGVAFVPADPPMSITVITKAGVRWGGRIGGPWRDAGSGSMGRLFLRHGDELTGWIGEDTAALCRLGIEDLRSKLVHRIREFEDQVRGFELRRGNAKLTYLRQKETEWVAAENRVAAPPAFVECLEALLHLKARRWLDAAPGELVDPVEVRVAYGASASLSFTLGRDAEGRAICLENGLAAEIDPRIEAYDRDLIESLRSLFGE